MVEMVLHIKSALTLKLMVFLTSASILALSSFPWRGLTTAVYEGMFVVSRLSFLVSHSLKKQTPTFFAPKTEPISVIFLFKPRPMFHDTIFVRLGVFTFGVCLATQLGSLGGLGVQILGVVCPVGGFGLLLFGKADPGW